jgi:hypothetical protein
MKVPDLYVGKRLFVGEGNPECLGRGESEIRGSSFIEGPAQIGDAGSFSSVDATVMIGPDTNSESKDPDRSLYVKGDTKIEGSGRTDNALLVQGDEQIIQGDLKNSNLKNCTGQGCNFTSSTINIQSWKGFENSRN